MSDLLLPCPFCGQKAYIRKRHNSMPRDPTYQAYCDDCGCGTSDLYRQPALAIQAWNQRAERDNLSKAVDLTAYSFQRVCQRLIVAEEERDNLSKAVDLTAYSFQRVCQRLIVAEEERDTATREAEKLQTLLNWRDDFLVDAGMWGEFVAWTARRDAALSKIEGKGC